jgi:hypothetical protein
MKKLNAKAPGGVAAQKKTLKVVRVDALSKPLETKDAPHDSAHSCCNPAMA